MAFYRNFCRIFCGGLFALSLFLPQNMFAAGCSSTDTGVFEYEDLLGWGSYCHDCYAGCICPQPFSHNRGNSDEDNFCKRNRDDLAFDNEPCSEVTSGTYAGFRKCVGTNNNAFYRCPAGFPNSEAKSDSVDDCSAEGFAFYYNGATHFRYNNSESKELRLYSAVANVCHYNKTCSPSSTTSTGSTVKASDLR